jgi:PAS domain S-box-containing protein
VAVVIGCVLMVAAIRVIDQFYGLDIRVGFIYILPISLAAWYAGRSSGFLFAVLCTAVRTSFYVTELNPDELILAITNTAITFSVFFSAALLVSKLKSAQVDLENTVADRTADLQAKVEENEKTAEALRDSRAQLQAIYDAMADAVMIYDAETLQVLSINQGAVRLFGYSEAELLSMTAPQFRPPGTPSQIRSRAANLLAGQFSMNADIDFTRKDGTVFYADVCMAVLTYQGRPAIQGVIRDVTERRRAEEAVRQSEATYRAIFNAANEALFVHDLETGDVIDFNQKTAEMYGFPMGDVAGLNAHFRQSAEAPHAYADRLHWIRKAASEGPQVFEWLARTRDGRRIWMDVSLKRATIAGRERILAAVRDIAQRRQAQEALQQSEENYRVLFEENQDGVVVLVDGLIASVNQAAADIYGAKIKDVLGKTAIGFLVPEDQASAAVQYETVMHSADPVSGYQVRVKRADGSEAWVEARGNMIQWGGQPALQVIVRDITQRRQAEEALRQSEENYRILFEQNQDGIIVLIDGKIVSANPAFARLYGAAVENVLGKPALDYIASGDRSVLAAQYENLVRGEGRPQQRPYRAVRADGTEAWFETRGKLIHWFGRPAVQVIIRDMTQRLKLEEQLRNVQKLEAVGQLAGGIAHDFNNIMTGILCHVGLLKAAAKPGTEVHETATIIEAAARRAADLTGQLLGFARRGKHQDVPVNVNAIVETIMRLVGGTLGPNIRVELNLPAQPLWTQGDPAQMEQVIMNLVVNARDAMADGGVMKLAARVIPVDEKGCAGHPGALPGDRVAVSVGDTGCGMSPEVRAHIFEPFFTTKPPGKGVGMGLAMVYGIIQNHGGWVEVESEVDRGSTLTVCLPAVDGPAEPPADGPAPSARAAARILLVDDEEVVRSVVTRMLTQMGHKVVAVANGAEAVEYYRAFGQHWDLVIIDMIMPDLSGRECLRALKDLNPNVRAILCTGGGADQATREALGGGDVGFIQKPYQLEQLADAITKALSRGPAA